MTSIGESVCPFWPRCRYRHQASKSQSDKVDDDDDDDDQRVIYALQGMTDQCSRIVDYHGWLHQEKRRRRRGDDECWLNYAQMEQEGASEEIQKTGIVVVEKFFHQRDRCGGGSELALPVWFTTGQLNQAKMTSLQAWTEKWIGYSLSLVLWSL